MDVHSPNLRPEPRQRIRRNAFSAEVRHYAERIDTRIILIDGTELAKVMIAHGVGVTAVAVYELKRVDSDFFAEEDYLTYTANAGTDQRRCRPPSASLARSASAALAIRSAASSAGYMPPALSDRMVDSISTASKIPLAIWASGTDRNVERMTSSVAFIGYRWPELP